MTVRRTVSVGKLTLHVPAGADREAVLREVGRALAEGATRSSAQLTVTTPAVQPGEGTQGLAHRIGRATAARLMNGGGS